MGEILADAVRSITTPALEANEHRLLLELAQLADDYTGPTLTRKGEWSEGRIGRIEIIPGRMEEMSAGRLISLRTLGWIREITTSTNPAEDGSHQLNIPRLARLLAVEHQARQSETPSDENPDGESPAFTAQREAADQELPGDFAESPDHAPTDRAPTDLTAEVDRLLLPVT